MPGKKFYVCYLIRAKTDVTYLSFNMVDKSIIVWTDIKYTDHAGDRVHQMIADWHYHERDHQCWCFAVVPC